MIIEIIAVCLLVSLKKFRLHPLLRTWTFYPVLAVQLALVLFQGSLFFHYYGFTPLVSYVEPAVILSFIPALLVFNLYKPAFAGGLCILAGTALNKLVIAQNGGHMPVYPTLSYLTGYVKPETFGTLDTLHVLGGEGIRLAFLSDVVDFGYSILSVGDVLIHLYACIMLYALIKAANQRFSAKVTQ
jgi:hypothetical protein